MVFILFIVIVVVVLRRISKMIAHDEHSAAQRIMRILALVRQNRNAS